MLDVNSSGRTGLHSVQDTGLRRRQSGFTLIEMAVVLVIIGILIGSFIGSFADRVETTRRDNTKRQLNDIMSAILGFASAKGRIPCPTRAVDGGVAQPSGGGVCTEQHGFVPGKTLGLHGAYNRDNLLIDSWGNPIRYSVATANNSAFTQPVGVGNGGMAEIGMSALAPAMIICDSESNTGGDCSGASPMISNVVFVILSLGRDGSNFVTTIAPNSDQGENSGEATMAANAAGENIVYTVASDRVFVSKSYSSAESSAGQFDDLIMWVSPYVLYSRMIEAGQLP